MLLVKFLPQASCIRTTGLSLKVISTRGSSNVGFSSKSSYVRAPIQRSHCFPAPSHKVLNFNGQLSALPTLRFRLPSKPHQSHKNKQYEYDFVLEEQYQEASKLLLLIAALIAAWQLTSEAEEEPKRIDKVVIEPQAKHADVSSTQLDPFEETTPLSLYELAKILFGVFYILPFRILFTVPIFFTAYVLARLSILDLSDADVLGKPLARWRRALLRPVAWLARLMLFIFGVYRIKRTGSPSPASVAPIVVSNHVSLLDAIVYVSDFLPTFVAKDETLRWPLISTFVKALQCIAVDRLSEDSRKSAVAEINRRTADHRFPQLLVFPEGTCTNGNALISFRLGAFNPGAAVQPIVIRYPHRYFNPAMVGSANMPLLFLRAGIQFVNRVEVHYLDPYVPSEEEKKNPTLFAQNVRNKMSAALGVPQTSHTFEDGLRAKKQKKSAKQIVTAIVSNTDAAAPLKA